MEIWDWGPPEWAAAGSVGAVIVYVALGIIAIRQLAESRRVRELQHRPYVLLDFHFRGMQVFLEVKNIGQTPARNVEVEFDKPLLPSDTRRNYQFGIFDAPIPMVAPGRVIRLPLGSGPEFFKEEATAPLSYTVKLNYTDMTGKEPYADPPLLLDLTPYKHTVVHSDSSSELAIAAKEIQRTLKGWSSSDGLKVSSLDRMQRDRSNERWDHYFDALHMLRNGGVRRLFQYERDRLKRKYL